MENNFNRKYLCSNKEKITFADIEQHDSFLGPIIFYADILDHPNILHQPNFLEILTSCLKTYIV